MCIVVARYPIQRVVVTPTNRKNMYFVRELPVHAGLRISSLIITDAITAADIALTAVINLMAVPVSVNSCVPVVTTARTVSVIKIGATVTEGYNE